MKLNEIEKFLNEDEIKDENLRDLYNEKENGSEKDKKDRKGLKERILDYAQPDYKQKSYFHNICTAIVKDFERHPEKVANELNSLKAIHQKDLLNTDKNKATTEKIFKAIGSADKLRTGKGRALFNRDDNTSWKDASKYKKTLGNERVYNYAEKKDDYITKKIENEKEFSIAKRQMSVKQKDGTTLVINKGDWFVAPVIIDDNERQAGLIIQYLIHSVLEQQYEIKSYPGSKDSMDYRITVRGSSKDIQLKAHLKGNGEEKFFGKMNTIKNSKKDFYFFNIEYEKGDWSEVVPGTKILIVRKNTIDNFRNKVKLISTDKSTMKALGRGDEYEEFINNNKIDINSTNEKIKKFENDPRVKNIFGNKFNYGIKEIGSKILSYKDEEPNKFNLLKDILKNYDLAISDNGRIKNLETNNLDKINN